MIGNAKSYELDPAKLAGGVEVTIPLDDGKGVVLVRPADHRNAAFSAGRSLIAESSESEELYSLTARLLAEACIVDWRGFKDTEGQPLPYTADAGFWLLTHVDGAYESILETATNGEAYRLVPDTKSD